jgi:hypothetical protein
VSEPRRSSSSVAAAIAASAHRARLLAAVQVIALIAIIAGRWLGGASIPPRRDGGLDALGPAPPLDAPPPSPDAPEAPCTEHLACRAACESAGPRQTDSCVRWADMLRTGTGGAARDRRAARARYRETCFATKDALACTHLALAAGLSHDLDLAPDWLDPARAPLGLLATACGTDRDRGRLACAALELLKAIPSLGRAGREALCGDEAVPAGMPAAAHRAACAARIALAACTGAPPDAEACQLAAADGLATAKDAVQRLEALCKDDGDLSACLYRGARDRGLLFTACITLKRDEASSIPQACIARALNEQQRRRDYTDLACQLGACQDRGRQLPARGLDVLQQACDAPHPNGCANLIYQRRNDPVARKELLDKVSRVLPQYADRLTGDPPADRAACELGSLDGCDAAIARLGAPTAGPADKQLAKRLADYRARLAAPLSAP